MSINQNEFLVIINTDWNWNPADYGLTDDEIEPPICEHCGEYVRNGVLVQDTEPYVVPPGFTVDPEDGQTVWHKTCF